MKILLVEDDLSVTNFIKKGLVENDYQVDCAGNGETGLLMAGRFNFDLVILDIMMPKMNGYDMCRKLRENNSQIPILMLSALGTTSDKVTGLDVGADDFLIKPFDFSELLARVRALVRRARTAEEQDYLKACDLELNNSTKRVFRAGEEIKLTTREFKLLYYFMKNKGKTLSRNDLANNVWDTSFDTGTNVVDVYVNYLRNKVDKNYSVKLIHTVVGVGYIFKEPMS